MGEIKLYNIVKNEFYAGSNTKFSKALVLHFIIKIAFKKHSGCNLQKIFYN